MDSAGLKAWTDLAVMKWSDTAKEHLLQLEGLIEKYNDIDAAGEAGGLPMYKDIRGWLQRQASRYPFDQ